MNNILRFLITIIGPKIGQGIVRRRIMPVFIPEV